MNENNYQIYKIPPDFSLTFDEEPVLDWISEADEAKVDQIWAEAQSQNEGILFNGKLLVFKSFENGKLIGRFIDYKYYRAAQSNLSLLKSVLNVKPIAISCICRYQNEILIGRRTMTVTGFPGCYELVPSGGISLDAIENGKINIKKQALLELEEEADIFPGSVESCIPLALIYDVNTSTYEIFMEIKLKEIKDGNGRGRRGSTLEYSVLEWMPIEHLFGFADNEKENFVPLSICLIEYFLMKE